MLVLSRRVGERLFIGNDIVVTIIDVRSDGVRVGIDAPREIRVTRAEIFEAVEQHNVEAASAVDSALEELRALAPRSTPSQASAPAPGTETPST
ncbi:carbon storage regulator CsrA [Demequina lutea]|uniref:Translational regulator CsrA n=1 Tax=Demequina lutea TaxID=431489 RepID=A0A7Z0CG49_9MICO|nr:carbon storage regulator CsrA [Demequina lutea]NYI40006.1 carbon storage regulator [Demequina lutea]